MKLQRTCLWSLLWIGTLTGTGLADAAVTQQIQPARIALGEAAQLTIAASGENAQPINPPMVTGLEFLAVSQSQRVEAVNGITRSTSTVTYRVIPRKAGVFDIPGAAPGAPSVALTVTEGGTAAAGTATGAPPATASVASAAVSADGSAFMRLGLPKHTLYVGETIPVQIQVGTRDGMVASMNGPPTINGDAFVLDKLGTEPQRTTEIIGGEPFTVFTWHSTLAAVKPGALSFTMETPLTVRVRTPARAARRFLDSPDDFFDEATLQSFFGGTTDKDVTVASTPAKVTVLALPDENRPTDFSGAVGEFKVTSELSDDKAAVGDPLTLRLKIAGTGNFDRVDTTMLHNPDHWKAYAPTEKFNAGGGPYSQSVKTFEQPLIATEPGEQTVPSLSFSWFNPDTHRYETAHTAPLTVAITPTTDGRSVASTPPAAAPAASPALRAATVPGDTSAVDGLRPDHAVAGHTAATLRPLYTQPAFIAAPSLLVALVSGSLLWLRRRDRTTGDDEETSLATGPLIKVMDEASSAGDIETFFKAARLALQRTFAPKWQLKPEAITIDDVNAHLDVGSDVARVFKLADESAYAGHSMPAVDFQRWKQLVLRRIHSEALS